MIDFDDIRLTRKPEKRAHRAAYRTVSSTTVFQNVLDSISWTSCLYRPTVSWAQCLVGVIIF